MFFSFFIGELLPLILVVYGIYIQIDWKKVQDFQIDNKSKFASVFSDLNETSTMLDTVPGFHEY